MKTLLSKFSARFLVVKPACVNAALIINSKFWACKMIFFRLFCQISSVSSEKLTLPRFTRCELSRLRCNGHSLRLSSDLCRIKRKENSSCNACRHPLQDLTHLLLDCTASEPLRRSTFGTTSSIFSSGPDLEAWPDCWVSSLERGRVEPSPPPYFLKARCSGFSKPDLRQFFFRV